MEPTDVTGTPAKVKEKANADAIFVMQYVETGDPMVAAIRAGLQEPGCSIFVTIDKMMARPEIIAGINAVTGVIKATPKTKITRDSLIAACQDIYEKALTDRQYASARGAVELQARLLGLLEQKVSVSHTYNVRDMSTDELRRIAAGGSVIEGEYHEVPGPRGLP